LTRMVAACLLAALGSCAGLAAAAPYDPGQPVPEPPFAPLAGPPVPQAVMGEEDWRSANDTVGAFTRGHIDILRWEAENRPRAVAEAVPEGEPLSPAGAVRIALGNRPDLLATEEMNSLERARADIAVTEFARDVHRAWIRAVAARQGMRTAQEAFDAADVATELAVRMTRVGNWGQDRLLREQRALVDAGIRLAQARQEATSAREALVRILGLWGDAAAITLPDRLPDLPETPIAGEGLEATAIRNHPQLPLAAIEAERAQRGLASRTREMWEEAARTALEKAVVAPPDGGNPLGNLITSAPVLERRRLPAGHDAERAARAGANAASLAVKIRSQVREAYHQYRVTYDIAHHARENARLSVEIQEDMLLRYNGMLKSTWDLLASARDRVESAGMSVQAQRDFWLAHTNLQAVLAGGDYPGPDAISGSGAGSKDAGGH
jgi:outer membrane protein TolC